MNIKDLEHIVRFKAAHAHGPGGQNRDHRATKVHMWVKVDDLPLEPLEKRKIRRKLEKHINHDDEIFVEDQETRSQEQNRDKALKRLIMMIEGALHEPPPRIPNEPPLSAEEERLQRKHKHSQKKKKRLEGRFPHGNA